MQHKDSRSKSIGSTYLEARGVTKRFDGFTAVDNVDLAIPGGQLVALLGPSGCGKTTLLRMLAGLETPDAGDVHIDTQSQIGIPVTRRRVGFVFQHYALFRHMTVFENVAFGLRVKPKAERPPKEEIARRVHELLGLVQLDNQSSKYPDQMSGGQRQRVALARALIVQPKILLLDEPFGALDANVRKDLRRWLRRLHDELHITSILVTHDQDEALEVADRIVVMNKGRIEQDGSPEEIYLHPANEFVYRFLGAVNVFHGRIEGDRLVQYSPSDRPEPAAAAGNTPIYVRPHEMSLRLQPEPGYLAARVARIGFSGATARIEVHLEQTGREVEIMLPLVEYQELHPAVGQRVFVAPTGFTEFDDYQI
ncbi:MAG: sulfate/molybdate ABC transporter ATP-binding protein [Spirochaeta sp.]